MYIYDSVQKTKLKFEPISPNQATLYVCGPTVYDDAHLGHARSAITFDLLVRVLRANGYETTFIRNITDIDDKIIAKMKQESKTLQGITQFYTTRYLEDMNALGVLPPSLSPKATESLDAITEMIQTLLDKGYAYKISNGDIYFDTTKDKLYGKLSNKISDDTLSRIEAVNEKRNQKDFALWKACNEKDVCFESKLGRGRPGWHIECSAMIAKHTKKSEKYSIDIHGGGADLLFPHHENEATQSRCASGHELAKYWMHNGFVQIDGEKMSKSLGNSFFLKDALKVYDGEVLRFYLASVHYRNDFNFNEEDLLVSKKRLDKLYRLKKRVVGALDTTPNEEFKQSLLKAMSDDMNISVALSLIEEMIASSNEKLDNNDKTIQKETAGNIAFISELLGVGAKEPFAYFQIGIDKDLKEEINTLITQRAEAKKSKDYKQADEIRNKLTSMNIAIMDTPNGTVWEKMN